MELLGSVVLVSSVAALVLALRSRQRSLELLEKVSELSLVWHDQRRQLDALRREVESLRVIVGAPVAAPAAAERGDGAGWGLAAREEAAGWGEPSELGGPGAALAGNAPAGERDHDRAGPSPSGSPGGDGIREDEPSTQAPPAQPPPPRRPTFDWEAWLGVRGAAVLGAVALVVAGSLFVQYSLEHDLVPPAVRVALILLVGVGCILGAELALRRRYAVTANAAAGAGVALLYAGLFAAHGVYDLVPALPALALLVLVTAVAALLAMRYDAQIVAVIGLLGGFATPVLVSSGRDDPVGLFSYVLLLNAGLFWVFVRKGWHRLSILSLLATVLTGGGWAAKYLEPAKLPVAAGAFGLLALVYLALPLLAKKPDRTLARVALAAGQAPFVLALYVAHHPGYADDWPIAFGLVACLDVAFAALLLRRNEVTLFAGGAAATTLFLVVHAASRLGSEAALGPTLAAAAIVVVVNAVTLAAPRLGRAPLRPRPLVELGGAAAGLGLAFWGLALTAAGAGEPAGPVLATLAALLAVVALRSGPDGISGVVAGGPAVVAVVAGVWAVGGAGWEASLAWRNVTVLVAVPLVSTLVAVARGRAPTLDACRRDAAAALSGVAVSLVFLAGVLGSRETGGRLGPLALALVVLVGLGLYLALRRGWTVLAPVTTVVAACFCAAWERGLPGAAGARLAAFLYVGLYGALAAYPFAVARRLRPGWRSAVAPWIGAALAGPVFFWPVHHLVVRGLGSAAIGLLPLGFATLSLGALVGVHRAYGDARADAPPALARARLRNLALFATVALGFVGVAIPLQLERQWITLGWAIEALAAVWVFGRLPHPGLKYLAGALYGAVFVRLVANPSVLAYEPRGLPILNWILYTYGVAAATFVAGAVQLGRTERQRLEPWERASYPRRFGLAEIVGVLGLVVTFVLVTLEIVDFFSPGRRLEWAPGLGPARDLTLSVGWGIYALALLALGVARHVRGLRIASLGFMLLVIAKVFLYDLSSLHGLYRVLSLLGLAAGLILVSLVYQRFVSRAAAGVGATEGSA